MLILVTDSHLRCITMQITSETRSLEDFSSSRIVMSGSFSASASCLISSISSSTSLVSPALSRSRTSLAAWVSPSEMAR